MILLIDNHSYLYETQSLCKMFFPQFKLTVVESSEIPAEDYIHTRVSEHPNGGKTVHVTALVQGKQKTQEYTLLSDQTDKECERLLCVAAYDVLSELTGRTLSWGVLTGIRPVKLVHQFREEGKTDDQIRTIFKEQFLVSNQKIQLCLDTADHEGVILKQNGRKLFSLYVSIPFCPTRCHYCSFVSHAVTKEKNLIPEYTHQLCKELEQIGGLVRDLGIVLDTVYFGGGTPTTLTAPLLDEVLTAVEQNFDLSTCREYTVEAGRPDTIDAQKLAVLRAHGISRISINPQTLNDSVLEAIGRKHTAADFFAKYALARSMGFDNINTDVIAGLQSDTLESFRHTIDALIECAPENITVHTLSIKRAATLAQDGGYDAVSDNESDVSKMVDYAQQSLLKAGYHPYYLYRQKNMLDNLENVGYAKGNTDGLYNVYIMDETHTILAAGAGGVTKLKNQDNGYIERIFNFKFPQEYLKRFDEIIQRKEQVIPFYEEFLGEKTK